MKKKKVDFLLRVSVGNLVPSTLLLLLVFFVLFGCSAGIKNQSKINRTVYSQTLPASLGERGQGGGCHWDAVIGRRERTWWGGFRGGGGLFRYSEDTDGEPGPMVTSGHELINWN